MLADLAAAAFPTLASDATMWTYAASTTLLANCPVFVVLANSSTFALFACRSDSIVRANAAALAVLAPRLDAVVYAKVARRRALAAVILDFVVRTDVRPHALPKLGVSECAC